MRLLITLFFILAIQSLRAQNADTVIKFRLEFYLNDQRMNLDEIEIKFIHLISQDNASFHDDENFYPLIDSNKTSSNLKKGEDILIKMTSDSVFIKKSSGSFQIVIKYKNYIDSTNEGYSYFQYGGRVVVGVITDIRAFRKEIYKRHHLLNIYQEDRYELQDKYPYLTVSEIYGSKHNNSLCYIAVKMDTEWGAATWWGSSSRKFKME